MFNKTLQMPKFINFGFTVCSHNIEGNVCNNLYYVYVYYCYNVISFVLFFNSRDFLYDR